MNKLKKVGLGGGCHWCTEAVFQHIQGVESVEQGYISSTGENVNFSEAVIVHFNPEIIELFSLIEIHLATHESESNHSFRDKYRSAVYCFNSVQQMEVEEILKNIKIENPKIITQALTFSEFKMSRESIQNYYLTNPDRPFCKRYINSKIELLNKDFPTTTKIISSLKNE